MTPLGDASKFFRSRSSLNACFVWKRSMILLTCVASFQRLPPNAFRRYDAFGRFFPPPNQ